MDNSATVGEIRGILPRSGALSFSMMKVRPHSLPAPSTGTTGIFESWWEHRSRLVSSAGDRISHVKALGDLRAARGAYYTPPVLAERLLDLAAAEGADGSTITALLDPARGGGAFLAPLAPLTHRWKGLTWQSSADSRKS